MIRYIDETPPSSKHLVYSTVEVWLKMCAAGSARNEDGCDYFALIPILQEVEYTRLDPVLAEFMSTDLIKYAYKKNVPVVPELAHRVVHYVKLNISKLA